MDDNFLLYVTGLQRSRAVFCGNCHHNLDGSGEDGKNEKSSREGEEPMIIVKLKRGSINIFS